MAHLHDVIAPRQRLDSMNIDLVRCIIHQKNSINVSRGIKSRSREIRISDECVYDRNCHCLSAMWWHMYLKVIMTGSYLKTCLMSASICCEAATKRGAAINSGFFFPLKRIPMKKQFISSQVRCRCRRLKSIICFFSLSQFFVEKWFILTPFESL